MFAPSLTHSTTEVRILLTHLTPTILQLELLRQKEYFNNKVSEFEPVKEVGHHHYIPEGLGMFPVP